MTRENSLMLQENSLMLQLRDEQGGVLRLGHAPSLRMTIKINPKVLRPPRAQDFGSRLPPWRASASTQDDKNERDSY